MALRAQRPAGPEVGFTSHPDEVAEAAAVADAIRRLGAAGTPWSEMAVLFRINAQSEHHEEALAERGIPYVVRGAARFFDRAEVRQAVTLLRGTARGGQATGELPRDRPGHPVRAGLDRRAARRPGARSVTAGSRGRRWSTRPPSSPGTGGDLGAFVDELDRRASEQHAPVADGVTLATLHAAKGLEWDAVFVTGAQDGTLPFSHADTPAEVEEERRLLYVGMTRARAHLAISWALARNPGGRQGRRPSPFLTGMLPASEERPATVGAGAAPSTAASAASRSPARPRRRSAGAPTARRPTTRSSSSGSASGAATGRGRTSVPAYVVFTDATLQLIAEHKPATESALLAISRGGPDQARALRRRGPRAAAAEPAPRHRTFARNF